MIFSEPCSQKVFLYSWNSHYRETYPNVLFLILQSFITQYMTSHARSYCKQQYPQQQAVQNKNHTIENCQPDQRYRYYLGMQRNGSVLPELSYIASQIFLTQQPVIAPLRPSEIHGSRQKQKRRCWQYWKEYAQYAQNKGNCSEYYIKDFHLTKIRIKDQS